MVTPRVLDATGLVASAGEHFGFGGIAGAPDVGRSPQDSGYHGWVYCQRTVGCAYPDLFAARAGFLAEALEQVPDCSRRLLTPWLGAQALMRKQRVVYSPFWTARQQLVRGVSTTPQPHADELLEFLARHQELLAADPFYSRFLQLERGRGFDLALPRERAGCLNPLLSRLEGPTRWYGQREQPVDRYVEPPLDRQLPFETSSAAPPKPAMHRRAA